jgi:NAD(P)-dependent dehydrogenase (short-subunit alcohol dehydrogenase family)
MKILAGQVAVITGGASGIGYSIAASLADKGVHLALADIEAPALDRAAGALEAEGVQVLAQATDVSDEKDFARFADAVRSRFGTPDLLFNNAGVGGGGGPMNKITLDDWRWVIGVNLFGVVHGIEAFLDDMIVSEKPAHIINTASVAGLTCESWMGPYNATKYAVVGISETLARETAETQVGVSVLCPGFVDTKIGESVRNAPAGAELTEPPVEMLDMLRQVLKDGQKPIQTSEAVLRAIENDQLYILTHPELNSAIEARFQAIREAMPG